MNEDKLFKKILPVQKNIEEQQEYAEFLKLQEEADCKLLDLVLAKSSPEEAQDIQDAFEEYKKVRSEVLDEKGVSGTGIEDIKALIPDNLWIKLVYDQLRNNTPEVDFDEIWKNIQEKTDMKNWGKEKENGEEENKLEDEAGKSK